MRRVHLGHLVEEKGSAVGRLEQSRPASVGAGKGSLFVAEKLAFQERFREGRKFTATKSLDARGLFMDAVSHQFLACAGFAGDQDGGAGRCYPCDQLAPCLYGHA